MSIIWVIAILLVSGIWGSVAAIVVGNRKGNQDLVIIGFKFWSFFILASILWCLGLASQLIGLV